MLEEGYFVQTAIGQIRNMRGNDDTNLVSPKRMSADRATGA
jgi:hypothetical protein